MRGQTSFETLVTVSFLFALLAVSFSAASSSFSKLKHSQDVISARKQVNKAAELIDSLYLQGYPAQEELTLSFPFGSEPGIDCEKGSVWVNINTFDGNTVVFSTFDSPCTAYDGFGSGRYIFKAEDNVTISKLG